MLSGCSWEVADPKTSFLEIAASPWELWQRRGHSRAGVCHMSREGRGTTRRAEEFSTASGMLLLEGRAWVSLLPLFPSPTAPS